MLLPKSFMRSKLLARGAPKPSRRRPLPATGDFKPALKITADSEEYYRNG
jgi:hypothetical protein